MTPQDLTVLDSLPTVLHTFPRAGKGALGWRSSLNLNCVPPPHAVGNEPEVRSWPH